MIAREGLPYIILFAIPGIVLLLVGLPIPGALFLGLAAFMAFFFRDPERRPPDDETLILSPADGRVVAIGPVEPGLPDSPTQISVFLSVLDVHINRTPISGEIMDVEYKPGAFHIASRDIASIENEQNVVTVRGRYVTIVFRQIAGVLARRVVFWKKKGDTVGPGERVGLMKFSSRMDVVLPAGIEVTVGRGDRVIGGMTVIGRVTGRTSGIIGADDEQRN